MQEGCVFQSNKGWGWKICVKDGQLFITHFFTDSKLDEKKSEFFERKIKLVRAWYVFFLLFLLLLLTTARILQFVSKIYDLFSILIFIHKKCQFRSLKFFGKILHAWKYLVNLIGKILKLVKTWVWGKHSYILSTFQLFVNYNCDCDTYLTKDEYKKINPNFKILCH